MFVVAHDLHPKPSFLRLFLGTSGVRDEGTHTPTGHGALEPNRAFMIPHYLYRYQRALKTLQDAPQWSTTRPPLAIVYHRARAVGRLCIRLMDDRPLGDNGA